MAGKEVLSDQGSEEVGSTELADWLTARQRSHNMSSIRSTKNRSTEERLAKLLRQAHIKGWRRHRQLLGKPDFSFQSQRIVIFVDGCFWHGCPKCYRLPKDNRNYWKAKVETNRRRDRRNNRGLQADGWKVVRIWEHTLKTEEDRQKVVRRLLTML